MPSSVIEEQTPSTGTAHFYPLTVRAITRETRDAVTVVFDVPRQLEEKFRYTQGQYVTLRALIDGAEVRRSYSICSAVQDQLLRVAVKRVAGGVFSSWLIQNVHAGDSVEVMPPEGRFHVPLSASHAKQYVAFAAGSGITPILSIIKTTLLTEPSSRFTLFYGNRASSTILFREELAELKDVYLDRFSLLHVMTREHQDVDLLNGRIDGEKAEQLLQQFCRFEDIDEIFLCGPRDMVDSIVARLKAMGFAAAHIKIELFTVKENEQQIRRKVASSEEAAECQVTVIVDGGVQHFSMQRNKTILDAALEHGIDLRHSCKSGVCATCRAKLVAGQVDMDANYALEDYEIARGFILSCQSYPVTDHVTVDFDQDN
ncbi:MAG TPA: 1,2-phenylacetyl-CoA epoxidase subunit PaaE [Bryobacteraceae bacterium]|jgi:ring-1,2-phenylacetyl-CoA epoxidase subunit PaaE|nr:1,2-phenylacetyl-CoA epoxidase subunit PaaE [Bryobacteraceae bacterium]